MSRGISRIHRAVIAATRIATGHSICRLILTVMLALVLACTYQNRGEALELRVVTRKAPPIVRMDQGELGGFAIDIWNSIAQRLQIVTRYQVVPDVVALLERLRSGKADIGVGAISITSVREREFDFSDPILNAGLQIMVRKQGSDNIQGPQDLIGKRVATTPGSTAAAFLREVKARVYQYPALKYVYAALLDRKVDAIVFDAPVLLHYAAFEGKDRVKTVGSILRQEKYGIVFQQNSPLRDQVNGALSAIREDGTYQKLYTKWFAN
jgi:glutamine transport system substrate-binding protein